MNILLITLDQFRGDALSCAGHPVVKTPNLDRLAREGVRLGRHYSQCSPCGPGRASLYTGLYQMNNRVVRNGTPLSDRFDNIAKAARRAGYDPTLFGYTDVSLDPTNRAPADPDLTTYEGVLPGFTTRVKLPEHERPWLSWLGQQGLKFGDNTEAHMPVGADPGRITNAPPGYSADQTQTAFLTGEFLRWLDEQVGERPWFAHLSFIRPHPPFIVPAPYNTMFAPDEVDGFARAEHRVAEAKGHPLMEYFLENAGVDHFVPGASGRVAELTDAEFRQIKATYYGMIAEVDAQLGRVFDAITERGEWGDTLIVFTSDHAEMLGDHFALGKGGYFDQSQHIPLIIRDPRQSTYGRHVSDFTEAVDIFPTLLDVMDVEALHQPDGRSLEPFLRDEATPPCWRDAVHWEFDFREITTQFAESWFEARSTELNLAVIRTTKWKYVHFPTLPPLLFDLERDPQNLVNLAEDPEHLRTRLEFAERLLHWRATHLDQTLALKSLTPEGVVTASR